MSVHPTFSIAQPGRASVGAHALRRRTLHARRSTGAIERRTATTEPLEARRRGGTTRDERRAKARDAAGDAVACCMVRSHRARTRWPRTGVSLLLLALVTAGCLGRDDALAPIVAIREPKSGTTRTTEDLRIVGYAMDDEGIAEIRVDGTDLLSYDVYASERGKRFVEFAFTIPDLDDGETVTRIVVVDAEGRQATLEHSLRIDTTPPTLELTAVTAVGEGILRVEGIARDDVAVNAIRIDDVPLQFSPSEEHRFSLDVRAGPDASVVVEDSAGNRVARSLQ